MLIDAEDVQVAENQEETPEVYTASGHCVRLLSRARLPTRHGLVTLVAFSNDKDHKDHVALIKGPIEGAQDLPVRLHSECLTGDAFGSLRCDCREQLEAALDRLGQQERGAILYMRQEGRGIGLANKVQAYALQDQGMDTVDANLHLGFDDDARDYQVAAAMLKLLGVGSVALMTNNPKKINGLRDNGVTVSQRLPLEITPNPHNLRYLRTKRDRSEHMLRAEVVPREP